MAIRPRTRKRVQAVRRAANGSAFEKCEECGVMIAIALFDMHECGQKRSEVKRFKSISSGRRIDNNNISKSIERFEDEPRSPFIFFLEDFRESYSGNMVDASRICYNVWRKMSEEERRPFIDRASEVDFAYSSKLNEEAKSISKVDDEADSNDVAKFYKVYDSYDHEEENDDSSDHFAHEFWEDDTLLDN